MCHTASMIIFMKVLLKRHEMLDRSSINNLVDLRPSFEYQTYLRHMLCTLTIHSNILFNAYNKKCLKGYHKFLMNGMEFKTKEFHITFYTTHVSFRPRLRDFIKQYGLIFKFFCLQTWNRKFS